MYLGIEIGGTKLQLGLGDGRGPPLSRLERFDVDASRGARGILVQIQAAARELLSAASGRAAVRGIGIGFGGPIDADAGRVVKSHQVADWDGFALVDWCRRELGIDAVLGNDADMAALAEAHYGAARGHSPAFYITIGTGIGGGLVIDGKLHAGCGHGAAEIGHLRPGLDCVEPGMTVESLASGPGIVAVMRRKLDRALPRDLGDLAARCDGDLSRLTAKIVAEAAVAGNRAAGETLDESCNVLGWAIAQMIALVAPRIVVIGGGVSLAGEPLFARLRAAVERYLYPPFRGTFEILPAALGEEMVVHGAIALAASRWPGLPQAQASHAAQQQQQQ